MACPKYPNTRRKLPLFDTTRINIKKRRARDTVYRGSEKAISTVFLFFFHSCLNHHQSTLGVNYLSYSRFLL